MILSDILVPDRNGLLLRCRADPRGQWGRETDLWEELIGLHWAVAKILAVKVKIIDLGIGTSEEEACVWAFGNGHRVKDNCYLCHCSPKGNYYRENSQ